MDTSKSRKSEAAATRKRRSSILKSQRAPRTPFSELEFHVATPPDASKSRRVSFSRRNGVAEFEITEATTAWKNVYEEHNKSLEFSGNESGVKSENTGHKVDYLGCRIQFQDAEAEIVNTTGGQEQLITSFNDVNPDYTNDDKSLAAPNRNFELSEFTDHQTNQLFDDDSNPVMREITDQLDMNFSALEPLDDDLEMQKDFDQEKKRANVSYVDIDFNATHFSLKGEESEVSDMSITDTIHSPKVAASKPEDRKSNIDDWVADKENIIVNPYVAPLPADNFAVSDDNDDVLVFDGKKCKFQSDLGNKAVPNPSASIINAGVKAESSNKRRTIVYNSDQGDISVTQAIEAQIILPTQEHNSVNRKTINNTCNNDSNISMTRAVPGNILMSSQKEAESDKQKTIIFDRLVDISLTQALPSNIIGEKLDERRKTIVYENNEGYLSMTEAVPVNAMLPVVAERRKTILYENDDADISMTQAVPINIIQMEKPTSQTRNTVVYDDDAVNITLAVPANVLVACNTEKRKTILFGNDTGDISMTQAIPTNLILPDKRDPDKRKTIVYDDEGGNLSVTQAVPANLILLDNSHSEKRKTIVYENDAGDMSVTQTVPNKVMLQEIQNRLQVLQERSVADMNVTPGVPTSLKNTDATNKRGTIVFDDNQGSVSITQPLPEIIMVPVSVTDKRKTIIYQDAVADISVTQTVPTNFTQKDVEYEISSNKTEPKDKEPEKKHAVLFDDGHTSLTRTSLSYVKMESTRKSILCDADDNDVDMSFTQVILNHENNTCNENTTITDDKLDNFSMTKPIPTQMISIQSNVEDKSKDENLVKLGGAYDVIINKSIKEHQDIFVYEAEIKYVKPEQQEDSGSELATESNDVLETSSSKVGESASDSTVSRSSGKTQVIDDPNASENDEQDELQPLDEGENKSAVSVIENHASLVSSSRHVKIEENPISIEESILNDLLDMSDPGKEDKHSMIQLISNVPSENATLNDEKGSKESCLLIKDSDEEQAEKKSSASDEEQVDMKSSTSDEETPPLENPELLPIEYQDEKRHGIVGKLQHKLGELKTFINQKTSPKNKHVKVESSDLENAAEQEATDKNESKNQSKYAKADNTVNNADDTNALLDMLSHFTDTRVSRDFSDDKKEVSPIKVKGLIAIENKMEENEPRRSLVPGRKSMVRSREDLLKDISMAQAMIKYVDEEDVMNRSAEDTAAESQEEPASPPRHAGRLSNEVVKTLKFDEDDSIHEINTRQELPTTPLKKTAFGETTYIEDNIRDSKTKVIPGFLSNVADDLKELMSDLVKPVPDVNPFETSKLDKSAKNTASTCSTHVQANLLTSSQIDLDPELESNAHSSHSMEERMASDIAAIGNESIARALRSEMIKTGSPFSIPESLEDAVGSNSPPQSGPAAAIRKPRPYAAGRVIVFDHHNPLNNVLLPAIDRGEVHKYNPGVPDSIESLVPEGSVTSQASAPSEKEPQHTVESRIALHDTVLPAGDASQPAIATAQSFLSNISKPMSLDESVDAKQDVKDIEVNTMIVMKKNRELLDASSSLTLVDDALARSAYDVEIDSTPPQKKGRSPVQVIFKIKDPESSVKLESDLTSNDDDMSEVHGKGKKRNYSPAQPDKHCSFATEEVTPKPATKMQKVSITPKIKKMLGLTHTQPTKFNADQHDRAQQCATPVETVESSQEETSSQDSDAPSEDLMKCKRKSKQKKPGTAITVQQLLTEYDMDAQIDQAALNREILAALTAKAAVSEAKCSTIEPVTVSNTEECKSLEVVSSFASSRRNFHSEPSDSEGQASAGSGRRGDWQPELMHEMSSKNLVTECESSVNVVAKIDVLPFMGTTDCEWESRSADTWAFRLLRARLRLLVRLQHRHGNAPRSRVRADTPVLLVAVDQPAVDQKKENPIAVLCVRFAAEAMRYFTSCGCARAGDVPALLRRCAGVARVAVRWGRALHAARQQLAFTLTEDGALSLKVANIPLRSVWEVTMRLEMVVSDAREAPWPQAAGVRVARVVAEQAVSGAELRRLLAGVPRDWGHAPRAVWKIFKYLKHKTQDDYLLLGL